MAHKVALNLNVFSATPLYQQLAEELRSTISQGALKAGDKLPSIRELSKQLQISTITVREAIDRLIEQGFVQSRQGSGNFVAGASVRPSSSEPTEEVRFSQARYEAAYHELDTTVHWSQEAKLLNRAFNDTPFHPWWDLVMDYDYRVYQPPTEPISGLHWDKALYGWSKKKQMLSEEYLDPRGAKKLREELSDWLNRSRQLNCEADQLILTSGSQQARELIARLLVERGTKVVLEEPGSITDTLAYSTKGAELLYIDQDEYGAKIDTLDECRTATLIHLISTANFPTGATLSLERREQIIDWASQNDVVIIEDAYGGGFYHELPVMPTIFELAKKRGQLGSKTANVIYIGSLSQVLNPSLRLGFVVIPKHLQKPLVLTKWFSEKHCSSLSQDLVMSLFKEKYFEEDVMRVTQAARKRRQALLLGLQRWPSELIDYQPIVAGFQQTIWFRDNIDDLLVFEKSLAARIGVIPISPYFRKSEARSGLSLSFVQMSEQKITEGLAKLLTVILNTVT